MSVRRLFYFLVGVNSSDTDESLDLVRVRPPSWWEVVVGVIVKIANAITKTYK